MRRKSIATFLGVALVSTLMVGAGAVGATIDYDTTAVVAYRGVPRVTCAVFNDGQPTTTSTTFQNVPGMKITHYLPKTQNEMLLITVSAFTKCDDTDGPVDVWCEIRVLVDGVECNPGGRTIFDSAPASSNDGNAWASHTHQFVCKRDRQGNHPIQLQFRVDQSGKFWLDNVVMSVQAARMW